MRHSLNIRIISLVLLIIYLTSHKLMSLLFISCFVLALNKSCAYWNSSLFYFLEATFPDGIIWVYISPSQNLRRLLALLLSSCQVQVFKNGSYFEQV